MSRKKFLCKWCGKDTGHLGEHYYIHLPLWLDVFKSKTGMACISCFEEHLGRRLNKNDFTECHINNPKLYPMSDRLRDRLGK